MVHDVRAEFGRATALHREGRLDEAVAIYRRLLKARPDVFEVQRLLVLGLLQAGKAKDAHIAARKTRDAHPSNPHAHVMLGAAFQAEGKPERALAAFEAAAVLDPGLVEAHYLAGNMLSDLGRHAEAAARFDRVIALDPRAVEARANRAVVLSHLGRSQEALPDCETLTELQPWEARHFVSKAGALLALGRFAEAHAAAEEALKLKPDLAEAWFAKGQGLLGLGERAGARTALAAALACEPGRALFQAALARIDDGQDSGWTVPGDAEAAGPAQPAPAEAAPAPADSPIEVQSGEPFAPPDLAGASAPSEVIPPPAADCAFEPAPAAAEPAAVSFAPGAAARDDASSIGEDAAGWQPAPLARDAEPAAPESVDTAAPAMAGEAVPDVPMPPDAGEQAAPQVHEAPPAGGQVADAPEAESIPADILAAEPPAPDVAVFPFPLWDGREMPTELVIVDDGDLGDLIRFGRLLRLVADAGIRARLVTAPRHVPLLSRIDARLPVVGDLAGVDAARPGLRWIALARLPELLAPDPSGWPRPPYLTAEPERVARWRALRGEGMVVGVSWQARAGGDGPAPELLAPLAELPGVSLVSLQQGAVASLLDACRFAAQVTRLPEDWDADGTYLDTAALFQHLDLVVTSDVALAHLAGARNIPVFLALDEPSLSRTEPDGNGIGAADELFPSLRRFHPREAGDWTGVFAEIAAAVRELAARAGR